MSYSFNMQIKVGMIIEKGKVNNWHFYIQISEECKIMYTLSTSFGVQKAWQLYLLQQDPDRPDASTGHLATKIWHNKLVADALNRHKLYLRAKIIVSSFFFMLSI